MKRRAFLIKSALIGSGLAGSGLLPRFGSAGESREPHEQRKRRGRKFYRIDSFCHFTTFPYIEKLEELSGVYPNPFRYAAYPNPPMHDVDARLKMMDDSGVDLSILVPLPNIESSPGVWEDPDNARTAARFINDAIADIVAQHPTRFLGVALLPTTNAEIMLEEFERAITENNAVGGYFIASPTAKPPDHPDYMQLYQKAVELNVPLWIHPSRPGNYPEYEMDEPPGSKYWLYLILGWVYDSSIAMSRIVLGGVFDTYPDLKIITHHRGGMIPVFNTRLQGSFDFFDSVGIPIDTDISKPYIEHFKKFYCDTTCYTFPETHLLQAPYDFFGADHVLFGTDAPYSPNFGVEGTLASRYNVEALDISNRAVENIFSNNILKIIPG